MTLDSRIIANEILDFAQDFGRTVSNLSLQKILYFVQGRHILNRGKAIMDGDFEAWPYGPVLPLVYDSFKIFGSNPITARARSFDYLKGEYIDLPAIGDKELKLFVRETANTYTSLSAGQLIDLSHVKGGPWDIVTRSSEGRRYGARIPNQLISENFRKHIAAISDNPTIGEPNEETPPPRD